MISQREAILMGLFLASLIVNYLSYRAAEANARRNIESLFLAMLPEASRNEVLHARQQQKLAEDTLTQYRHRAEVAETRLRNIDLELRRGIVLEESESEI